LRTACQVVRKRFLAGQRLVVYCKDGSRLAAFDRMLWAFDDTSFVPHVLANDPLAADTPVVLTAGDPQQAAAAAGQGEHPPPSWLLNLDHDCPPGFEATRRTATTSAASRPAADRHTGARVRASRHLDFREPPCLPATMIPASLP
jgi:hypothetical protein